MADYGEGLVDPRSLDHVADIVALRVLLFLLDEEHKGGVVRRKDYFLDMVGLHSGAP